MYLRLMTPVGTSVVLMDPQAERASSMKGVLNEQGYTLSNAFRSFDDLMSAARTGALTTDVVVLSADRIDEPFLDGLRALNAMVRVPIAIFSEDGSTESINAAVAAGANAFVVIGMTGNRVRSAIDLAKANFSSTLGLREELDEARNALRERKIIERAKGIVMKQKGLDEAAAYTLLRSRAMEKGIRLVDLASMITEAAEVMG